MSIKPSQRDSLQVRVTLGFILSALLHLPLLFWLGTYEPDLDPLPSTTFHAGNELAVSLVEESKKDEDREKRENLQYVSFEAPEVQKTPEKANYVDQYESEAEQEMVRKALPGAPQEVSRPESVRGKERSSPTTPTTSEATRDGESLEPDRPDDGGEAGAREARLVLEKGDGAKPERGGVENTKTLFPKLSDSTIVNPMGEGGSLDYLRDVSEGEKTLLNRKTERYWAFFDRVKLQIADEYSAGSVYRRRDPYGNVYGVKDRYSTVRVTLNSDGSVRQLHVSRRSGLDFLDDEAVRSVRAAAPFHNPPEGLKDEDGLVHFTFGFYLEVTAGPSIRLFR